MREQLPLFPLPNVDLFPDVLLPLHIFEPRYRIMVEDTLKTHKKIGMVLLKKGWEENYYETPEIFEVGCMGQIVDQEKLPDGKFNILLKGVSRFSVARIVEPAPYRRAKIALLPDRIESLSDQDAQKMKKNLCDAAEALPEYFVYNKLPLNRVPVDFAAPLPTVVDTISYYLSIDPYEKQPILEETRVDKRAELLYEKLIDILQIKRAFKEAGKFNTDPGLN